MNVLFTPQAWSDYLYWQQNDKKILKRINELIKDIKRQPFDGKGKPEPLKYELAGCWSRRINQEHRLVYYVTDQTITILAAKFHY